MLNPDIRGHDFSPASDYTCSESAIFRGTASQYCFVSNGAESCFYGVEFGVLRAYRGAVHRFVTFLLHNYTDLMHLDAVAMQYHRKFIHLQPIRFGRGLAVRRL